VMFVKEMKNIKYQHGRHAKLSLSVDFMVITKDGLDLYM